MSERQGSEKADSASAVPDPFQMSNQRRCSEAVEAVE